MEPGSSTTVLPETPHRRLSAILASDVVGYSRLIEADEAGTLESLRGIMVRIVRPALERHRGRIVKLMGDGLIAEFGSVVDAAACALAVQRAVATDQADRPAERRLRFRVGINSGDVVVEGDDLMGDGVNIAARLEAAADPGGILLSGAARDQLVGKTDMTLDPLGLRHFKNISRPVSVWRVRMADSAPLWRLRTRRALGGWRLPAVAALLLLLLAGAGTWWLAQPDDTTVRPGIAVLPFDNYGGDEMTGRLADGITEDIITDLARFRDLDVIARNSTEVYKGKPVDIRQIGRDLKVNYVLEGSLQRDGARLRATAQLVDAVTGAHVWAESWDRPTEDVFAVQSEIAERVARSIGGWSAIFNADRAAAKRKPPANLSAYDLYLLGTEAKHRSTPESLEEAIGLLKQAIALDPQFARAWTTLAWAYNLSAARVPAERADAMHIAALEAAQRAVALDPMDAEAHAALAMLKGLGGDLNQAEIEYDKALELNPNNTIVLATYAGWASSFGKPERGAEVADQLIRVDPNYPPWAGGDLAYAYLMAGRYEDSLRAERMPEELFGRGQFVGKASALGELGRTDEAKRVVATALARFPDITIEGWINRPDYIAHERQRFEEAMRAAQFPPCADAKTFAAFSDPVSLPECAAVRATAVARKEP